MKIATSTQTGRREENQDSLWTGAIDEDVALAIVCDGMGGHNAGSTASALTVSELAKRIKKGYRKVSRANFLRNLMMSSIEAANTIVYESAKENPQMEGRGTTCVAAIIENDVVYMINVGDSRAYVIRGNEIQQITEDHSVVGNLIAQGKMTEEEAKYHPQRNVITRAVGIKDTVLADYYEFDIEKGDIILLCSDGLCGYCNEETMVKIVSEHDIETAVNMLSDTALANGSTDNITVVLILNDAGDDSDE